MDLSNRGMFRPDRRFPREDPAAKHKCTVEAAVAHRDPTGERCRCGSPKTQGLNQHVDRRGDVAERHDEHKPQHFVPDASFLVRDPKIERDQTEIGID